MAQLARQGLLLDERRYPHLLVESLALGGLAGLLVDELADAVAGAAWAASVVRRRDRRGIVLLRQAWTEVERADQVALRDERNDEGDAGLTQGLDRRRLELEAGEVDGPVAVWR